MPDILFTYQHKAREIEGLCLLKLELERRGYTSDLFCTFGSKRTYYRNKPKLIVSSALYDDGTLWFFAYKIVGFIKKIVNLQWEQVLSNYDELNPNCYHNPKNFAKEATHLCWGSAPQRRIINGGVKTKNAIVAGAIHMDFLLPHFESYYLSKDEVAQSFNLNSNMKWCLFISSFTTHNMTEEEFDTLVDAYGDEIIELKNVTIKTKKNILSWFEESLKLFPNYLIIYRPHPDETSDLELIKMSNKYPNFKIIPELSVKQWIKISDYIYTWYSTAAAEIAIAKKGFGILRPVYIKNDYDISIYRNASYIITKEDFLNDLKQPAQKTPIDIDILKQYYSIIEKYPSYLRIVDIIEEALTTNVFDMQIHPKKYKVEIKYLKNNAIELLKKIIVFLFGKFAYYLPFIGKSIQNSQNVKERLDRDYPKNFATEYEIESICKRLRPLVYTFPYYQSAD